jgi:hypothetical protein
MKERNEREELSLSEVANRGATQQSTSLSLSLSLSLERSYPPTKPA